MSRLKFDASRKDATFQVDNHFIIEKEIEVSTRQG